MRIELTKGQQQLQERCRAFGDEHVAPLAAEFDRRQSLSDELVAKLAKARFLGSQLPREYGGRGLDLISYGLLHQEIGRACSSTRSLLTVHDMVAEAIHRLGNATLRETWLPVLAAGEAIGAFALTEPEAGSDAGGIATTALADSDGYVLNGQKKWISFGQLADVFLIVARVGESIGGFLVPRDTPGLTITPITGLLGLRASMLAALDLSDCRVPAAARIGPATMPSGLVVATALQLGRYSVAWGCVGIGEACLEASFRYSDQRHQFGVPLSKHQLIRRLLTDMLTDVRAARLLSFEAGYLAQHRRPGAIEATLIAKYFASRMITRVSSDTVQIHGAAGGSSDQPVERYFRDARLMEIIEGSTQIQQITIPKYGRQTYATAARADEETHA